MWEPVAAGLKVSVTVQLVKAPSVEPHVLDVMLNSLEFFPVLVMLVMLTELDPVFVILRVAVPVFVIVTFCGGLVVPAA